MSEPNQNDPILTWAVSSFFRDYRDDEKATQTAAQKIDAVVAAVVEAAVKDAVERWLLKMKKRLRKNYRSEISVVHRIPMEWLKPNRRQP